MLACSVCSREQVAVHVIVAALVPSMQRPLASSNSLLHDVFCMQQQWRFPMLSHSHCVCDASQNMKDEEAELRELQVYIRKL